MVLLGGLELVAAGYIIHKHQQNKRDKQRLEEEAAALEESQYRIFPPEGRHSRPERRRRSHSRRRHSEERYDRRNNRPHSSHDGKYRRESPSPRPKPILKPTNYSNPQLVQQRPPPYNPATAMTPPMAAAPAVQRPAPQAQVQQQPQPHPAQSYPPDVKYGWTDDQPTQQRPSHDPNYPPTGWPSEWQSSQGASSSSRPSHQRQSAESSRGRRQEDSPRVRFSAPRHSPSVRSLSRSPPPSYRA